MLILKFECKSVATLIENLNTISMSKARQQDGEMGEGMILFYARNGFWNSLDTYCQETFKKSLDPLYVFWRGFSLFQQGQTSDAINELVSIQTKKEISYACIVALLYYQGKARNTDREEIDSLRAKEREERRNGSDKAIYQAAFFFMLVGENKKAEDLLEERDSSSPLFSVAIIWQKIFANQQEQKTKLESEIDTLYANKDKNIPKVVIFLARALIKNQLKKYEVAAETLNEGIVYYSNFLPFMTEKLVCLMSLGEWEQFQQLALQVSQRESSNIPAIIALAFYEIARQGNIDNGFMKIKELEAVVDKREGKNAKILFSSAHMLLRVCGRNFKIVELLQRLVEKCRQYDPLNADYAIEQGNQLLILGRTDDAYKAYQEAASLDESKLDSITGMIECKLLQEEIDDAQNQIEFVNVMQQTIGRTPTIAYLQAMLTIRKPHQTNQSIAEFYKILDGALKAQITYSKTLVSDFTYYSKLNPNFLFSIAELYLRPISVKEMLQGGQNPNPSGPIGKGIKILQTITKQIPGFLPAYLLLAKGKLAVSNQMDASMAIARVLQIDSRNQEGSIISAMIRKKKRDFQAAQNSLQDAISINFKIRENPLFMLLKGEIEFQMGDYTAAEETMLQAVQLPSVRRKIAEEASRNFKVLAFSEKDRCSIYLLLAKCHMKTKKTKECKNIMTQTISQFAGTNEEVHVLLANAQIAVETGDIKKAMSILKQVKTDSTYFVESRKLLADIHLKCLKSRKGYAKCYYQIIENSPSFENFKIYGDALVRINEPEEASVAYEKAYQQKSDNQGIIRDLGRAYALAHDYQKATKFYEDNIEKLNRPDLILDLAKLCVQLKRYDRAEQLLTNEIFADQTGNYDRLRQNVEANFQLYKMHLKKQGSLNLTPNEKARKHIKAAIQLQKLVIEKLKQEGGSIEEDKLTSADLYFEIAKYTNEYDKNIDTTITMLEQCLRIFKEHQHALELLGNLLLKREDLQKSQETCRILLKVNPKNDAAGSILAEILLKGNKYEEAIQQFKKTLDEEPDKYPVLVKLIDFFRRNNDLQQAKKYIQKAQNKASNSNDAGLCFCRGLYHKYTRNPGEALVEFNKAKKASQYAEDSLTHMVDIFLCPEQDYYFSALEGQTKPMHPENVRICESLLREMQSRASNYRFIVMDCFVSMLGGKVKNIEEIIRKLVDVLTVRTEYIPAMFAMAIAKFIAKKDTEANNFLKICGKMSYQSEYGEELEKAWLLHAESYIQIKKFDNAEEILRMLLRENKSCSKAEELMGLIREKEQAYADACEFYERAFQLTARKSAAVGYRLAHNYLKAKRYVDCLEICRQVTEVHPTYTNIRVEIEQKAIAAIR